MRQVRSVIVRGGSVTSSAARSVSAQAVKVAAGTTAQDALREAGISLDGPEGAVVVREVGSGALRDLAWAPEQDAAVEAVRADSPDGPAVRRPPRAAVVADAVAGTAHR